MGWRAFGRQHKHNVMKKNFPLSLKRKVYNQCILPVITYGSETCVLKITKALERKLKNAQREMERIMFGITWRDRKRGSWIRKQTKVKDILITINKKKKYGHGQNTSCEEQIVKDCN